MGDKEILRRSSFSSDDEYAEYHWELMEKYEQANLPSYDQWEEKFSGSITRIYEAAQTIGGESAYEFMDLVPDQEKPAIFVGFFASTVMTGTIRDWLYDDGHNIDLLFLYLDQLGALNTKRAMNVVKEVFPSGLPESRVEKFKIVEARYPGDQELEFCSDVAFEIFQSEENLFQLGMDHFDSVAS